jgi:hypothetical protein
MSKKCSIYLANTSFLILGILITLVVYFIYKISSSDKIIINQNQNQNQNQEYPTSFIRPNYAYNNIPGDVFLNPYMPPLRDERYLVSSIPINISTNVGAVDTTYRQIGILTPLNGVIQGKILPLMGRPLFVNRNKWQYYTISDQNNSVKLPIVRGGRSCTNEYGCDQLYNADTVYVEGYNQAFKITIYDNDTIKYIPFI